MKILGIAGSPRTGGNTQTLLARFLETARMEGAEVDTLVLSEIGFGPCRSCEGCSQTGICVVNDGMEIVYNKVREASSIVIASPIFFGSVTAQLKMMIDRFQCYWVAKYILKRPLIERAKGRRGFFISVGAMKEERSFRNSEEVVRIFFNVINMEYTGALYYLGVEKRGDIIYHPRALHEVAEAGRYFVGRLCGKP